jgi:CDP-diacylglycerol--glycerol-3-phosphate 3-phosphatidyltransferase
VPREPGSVAANAPLWNIANIVTMARVALVPVFAALYLADTPAARLAAAAVFAVAALTDKLDGYLARSRGLVTDFGKIADPIADKALILTALVLLSMDGTVPWWVTVVIIVRELGITVLRFALVRRAIIPASQGGKLKTVLQIVFIGLLVIPWSALVSAQLADMIAVIAAVIMYAALAVTVVTGVDYVQRAIRIARSS